VSERAGGREGGREREREKFIDRERRERRKMLYGESYG
jgi:hypothetical protein